MKYFNRKLETPITEWMRSGKPRPLLVKGARRVGKTSLVEYLGRAHYGEHFVKLDFQTDLARIDNIFDRPTDDLDGIVGRISEYARRPLQPEKSLIFLDEVQLSERALNSLRFFSGSPWRVIASGSLLGVAAKKRSLPFPSGVDQLALHPCDFEEFLWAVGEERMADDIRRHARDGEAYVLHDRALELYHSYCVIGGMPRALAEYLETRSFAAVAAAQREIDETYTADMTDPANGISGIAAKRIWESLPKQLLRASTKKFKYSEVVRGGRRERLLEPLEWLAAAGIVTVHDLTCDVCAPLTPHNDEEGSFFKVYVADTGLMFFKFGLDAQVYLDAASRASLSAEFRGALAENIVMQALKAQGLKTFYWMPDEKVGKGEVDFIFQDKLGRVVPVEVKSSRNVRSKSLRLLVERGCSPFACRLSENNFGVSILPDTDCALKSLPIYAAFCIGEL